MEPLAPGTLHMVDASVKTAMKLVAKDSRTDFPNEGGKWRVPGGDYSPLSGHLQNQLRSPAAAGDPCGEGPVEDHRLPLCGPRGSGEAGAECSRTSGTHLGCRRGARERL